jgi:hypothetical protein
VTDSTVASDLLKTLDVQCNLTTEITLYHLRILDDLADLVHIIIREILATDIRINTGFLQDSL